MMKCNSLKTKITLNLLDLSQNGPNIMLNLYTCFTFLWSVYYPYQHVF